MMTIMKRFRKWLAEWLIGGVSPFAVVAAEKSDDGLQISAAAMWEANRSGKPIPTPALIFTMPKPMPGSVPSSGLALDNDLVPACDVPAYAAAANFAMNEAFHEGLFFLGYNYLAELAQRGEYRRMAEIRAEHATRKWIELKGPKERVEAIGKRLDELGVKDLFREALEKDAQFGRMQIFLDFGDFDNEAEIFTPLKIDPVKINPARPLLRLRTLEPMWSYPAAYRTSNPLAPDFYKPPAWYVYGKTVSDTRLLTFVGRPVPDLLKPLYAFGGLSLTQMAKPYVDNWLRARQSCSDLLNAFSVMVLKTNLASILGGQSGDDVFARVDIFNRMRDNRGTFAIDKDSEEFENISAPLSGTEKLQAQSQEQMSSISGIPLVILLGVTPSGLNASSDGEIRSFYADIKANEQERTMGPNVKTVIDVVQLSLFGDIDERVTFEWPSLWETSRMENAEAEKVEAETDAIYVTMGALGNDEVRENLAAHDDNRYAGIDLSGPPPVVEEEEEENDKTDPEPTGS